MTPKTIQSLLEAGSAAMADLPDVLFTVIACSFRGESKVLPSPISVQPQILFG